MLWFWMVNTNQQKQMKFQKDRKKINQEILNSTTATNYYKV